MRKYLLIAMTVIIPLLSACSNTQEMAPGSEHTEIPIEQQQS